MTRWRSILPVVIILALSAGLIVWITHNMAHNSPAGQIKAAAKDPALAQKRARWVPSSEQQKLIDEAASTSPDYLSDDLVPVLAAITPVTNRELIFYYDPNPHHQWLVARTWALRQDTVHGDAREVQLFLDILETPVPNSNAPAIEASSPEDMDRLAALYGLIRAALAGEPHHLRFPEFERIALENLNKTTFRDNAAMLLVVLGEVGGLGPQGKEALDKLRAKAPYFRMLKHWVVNAHTSFRASIDAPEAIHSNEDSSSGQ